MDANFGMTEAEIAQMEKVFNAIDTNKSGYISKIELTQMLDSINFRMTGDRTRDVEIMMYQVDRNLDDRISRREFFAALNDPNAKAKWGTQNYSFNFAMKLLAQNHEHNPVVLEKMNKSMCWPPPVFMVIISIVELSIFLYYSSRDCDGTPSLNECPKTFSSILAYRMCCRDEAWRFLSYALVHAGWGHLAYNLIIQLLFGIYLEVINGPFRVLIVYIMGALAGSMTSSVFDPTANVVGASGAVYTLVGAWVAFVTINWDTMPTPRKQLMAGFLFILTCLDFGNSIYTRYNDESTNVSFAGHAGGFVMGATFGTYILKNDQFTSMEVYIKWFGISIAVSGVLFAVLFNLFNDPDKDDICPLVEFKCA